MTIIKDPIFFSRCFTNFEEYQALARGWNLDFKKISAGSFLGSITMLDMEQVQVAKTWLSGTILQNGLTPPGYRTFVLPADDNQHFIWLNKKIDSTQLIVFPENNILDSVSPDKFHVLTIAIKLELLDEIISKNGYLNLDKNLNISENTFPADKNFLLYIQSFIRILFKKLYSDPLAIYTPVFRQNVCNKLPEMMLRYLDRRELTSPEKLDRRRDFGTIRAVEYVQRNAHKAIVISDLCEATGLSERSLEYGFQERFSLSPKKFIKGFKLNKVRQALTENHDEQKLSIIAKSYGFKHMGQFSADYKAMFDELPSETLASKF